MKNAIVSIVTLALMLVINYVAASMMNWSFIDLSLFVGLCVALGIRFFTSSGGLSSNAVRVQVQSMTGIKVEEEKETFKPTFAYYTAIVYTLISLISIIIYYKDYFI
ncbi:hypothetical protein AWM68_03165 [Fictibacillus phosphorivorans]|uniref:DUF3899 domain-containing protein n=1 Tax=Fictibacillus phosphorivorans TaxID=1221500 RepID=A0A163SK57_9BACL|nr:hypothetical protein [Fictibacillus phosphorivorans]KZE69282.1 hypothetical protein AWM68_03165 [Fictibacillus phosphorivorans]